MALVVSGLLNKQVGGELGISEITVKAHRGKVMRKMKADSLADLVKMAARLRLDPSPRGQHPPLERGGASQAEVATDTIVQSMLLRTSGVMASRMWWKVLREGRRHEWIRFAPVPPGPDGPGGARRIVIACPSPGRGAFRGTRHRLSHDPDRRVSRSFTRGRPERRANASSAARTPFFIADVRASLRAPLRSLSSGARPTTRASDTVTGRTRRGCIYVRPLRRDHESLHRSARDLALHALHAGLRRSRRGFAWPWLIPTAVESLVVQDAVAHNEGLAASWKPRRAFSGRPRGQRKHASRKSSLRCPPRGRAMSERPRPGPL